MMALSFAESAKRIYDYQATTFRTILEEPSFTVSDKYEIYQNYSDINYSTIDESKTISLDMSQINLTQEVNSQLIPFEMPRYFDGIDLMDMTIVIHGLNPDSKEFTSNPVNVSYSTDKIRFSWLVDDKVTALAGEVKFEIVAYGINEKQNKYLWRTKPNGKLTILPSLSGNGVVPEGDPDYMDFLSEVEKKATEAEANAMNASISAKKAEEAVVKIDQTIDGVKQDVMNTVQGNINTTLDDRLRDYYTKPEIDNIKENITPDEIHGGTGINVF